MIIAVDGPAASGKGTLARRLAAHYGLNHLDTGSLYRATALAVRAAGADPDDAAAAARAAAGLDPARYGSEALRAPEVGEWASRVAAVPEVRAALLDLQRRLAATPPGAVLDGRDIGTVVCPGADVKLFVTASPETRALRRYREHQARGEAVDYDAVLADIRRRDGRDRDRAVSPLRPAADAHLLDTEGLDIEAAFQAALAIVEGAMKTGGGRLEPAAP